MAGRDHKHLAARKIRVVKENPLEQAWPARRLYQWERGSLIMWPRTKGPQGAGGLTSKCLLTSGSHLPSYPLPPVCRPMYGQALRDLPMAKRKSQEGTESTPTESWVTWMLEEHGATDTGEQEPTRSLQARRARAHAQLVELIEAEKQEGILRLRGTRYNG